jgi:hypothetical protein
MEEQQIKTEMRLWALEVLVCNLFALNLSQTDNPLELLGMIQAQMIAGARQKAFPGFDAAHSDHLSAELEGAVDRLLGMANEQISLVLEARKKQKL